MNHEHEVTTDSLPMIVGIEPAAGETPEKVGFKIEGISAEALTDGTLQLNLTSAEAVKLVQKLIGVSRHCPIPIPALEYTRPENREVWQYVSDYFHSFFVK